MIWNDLYLLQHCLRRRGLQGIYHLQGVLGVELVVNCLGEVLLREGNLMFEVPIRLKVTIGSNHLRRHGNQRNLALQGLQTSPTLLEIERAIIQNERDLFFIRGYLHSQSHDEIEEVGRYCLFVEELVVGGEMLVHDFQSEIKVCLDFGGELLVAVLLQVCFQVEFSLGEKGVEHAIGNDIEVATKDQVVDGKGGLELLNDPEYGQQTKQLQVASVDVIRQMGVDEEQNSLRFQMLQNHELRIGSMIELRS